MLTKRQKEVLDFTEAHTARNGIAPTLQEIAKHLKIRSAGTVHEHIQALEKKGFLNRKRGSARALISNRNNSSVVHVPVLGFIAAGQPIEALETEEEHISVLASEVSPTDKHYALRVQGDSMIDEGIFNGDIVIIREQKSAENGQTVVAIIDDNLATLKKIYREKSKFKLQPANQSLLPFYRNEVEIRGIVVKIIRNLNPDVPVEYADTLLGKVTESQKSLEKKYFKKMRINPDLNRTLVSFQANKKQGGYRWYKFKEGYSSTLVSYYLESLNIRKGKVLDPFAGSGTSLFTSASHGLKATGIELLPICHEIMEARKIALSPAHREDIITTLKEWVSAYPWHSLKQRKKLAHLKITEGAFPLETEEYIGAYLFQLERHSLPIQKILRFALMCVLEEVSFTRKDGQYLRWDHRSNKKSVGQFDKGLIKTFDNAILSKLSEIISDLETEAVPPTHTTSGISEINVIAGSCLDEAPALRANQFDLIITSPPYCNRYDYTRTYALELMLLGIDEENIRRLRQTLITCTVENKEKTDLINKFSRKTYSAAHQAFNSQQTLQTILTYLEHLKDRGELNNPGIYRMVKNYFYEMALLIVALAEKMKARGYFVMVNDNVRYAGIEIPVDLILSDFAEAAGLQVKEIQVLPRGKGNSSQQMGKHGRTEIRKCVYVWQKL